MHFHLSGIDLSASIVIQIFKSEMQLIHLNASSSLSAFAPAIFHKVACSFISCSTRWVSGWQLSKTQRLCSFQIDQATRITREFRPFLASLGVLLLDNNYQLSGPIPSSINNLTNLGELRVSYFVAQC
ncbi:uncharacterized protein LOC120679435 [Panicum virgatum]|uniref:uncharacterized protein LOC120679435 n=1 Tax=Panicum virgatum TaxID=38727 RepID=UPI0019D53D0A|nr:uncharacterized protein LOC120679435 [Panicum virgatum]